MLLVTIVFFVLLFLDMPVAFALGVSGMLFFVTDPSLPSLLSVQRMVGGTQDFPLLAVPFFILSGNLMNATGITRRLIRFSNALTGHLVGGLAHVSIVLSAMMGGISGSSVADSAMQSRILAPQMMKRGYSGGFSVSIIAVASLITSTIPPSIGLILYGYIGDVSIGKLFMAGIFPGILMALVLMVAVYIVAKRKGYDSDVSEKKSFSWREVWDAFKESYLALLFPVLLVGGIRFGVFTPSEGGAFAVVYALVVGMFVFRELTLKDLWKVLTDSVVDNAVVMLIIAMASIIGYVITFNQVPQNLSIALVSLTHNKTMILILILLFLAIAGMFMEATVNTLLLTPIFVPIIEHLGIDPVYFGILMMTIITFGGMTPPVGVNMYTVCSMTRVSIEDYIKESWPFILAVVVLEIILVSFPNIILFVPHLLMKN